MRQRLLSKKQEYWDLHPLVDNVRKDHPKMSLRRVYNKLNPDNVGRDKFEKYFISRGYKVRRVKNYRKTTDSSGVKRFENAIQGKEFTGVNQCFVSDITYYELGGRFYYLTFIMDMFNREVVGYSVSRSLKAQDTTLPAIRMMIRKRGRNNLTGAIIHSDGGGQYYQKDYLDLTRDLKLTNSMGKECFENPHAERLNGTLKNDYIIPYNPRTYNELERYTKKAIYFYNNGKPHDSLNGLTPIEYRLAA